MIVFTFLLLKLALFLGLSSNECKHKDNVYKNKRMNVWLFVQLYKNSNCPDQQKGLPKGTSFLRLP